MNIDLHTIVMIFGFIGVLIAQFMRSPKEISQDIENRLRSVEKSSVGGFDHEARLRELEKQVTGTTPLWHERHEKHETIIETLTTAVTELKVEIRLLRERMDTMNS